MQPSKDGTSTEINFNKDWWLKHDMKTFAGRMRYNISVTDFTKSFVGESTLRSYEKDIADAKAKTENGIG